MPINTKRIVRILMCIIWSVNRSAAIIQWIFLSFALCVTMCESVSVSTLMNSPQCHWVQTLTEQNRWDDSEAKHCSGSHHFRWRPRANIIGGSGWWSKITERGPPFPFAKQSQLKESKDLEAFSHNTDSRLKWDFPGILAEFSRDSVSREQWHINYHGDIFCAPSLL